MKVLDLTMIDIFPSISHLYAWDSVVVLPRHSQFATLCEAYPEALREADEIDYCAFSQGYDHFACEDAEDIYEARTCDV